MLELNIMEIIVSSKNPVKINATLKAFQQVFIEKKLKVKGVSVPSNISEQPISDEETRMGAYNRAENAY